MTTNVLALMQIPGFEANEEAHQLIKEKIEAIHYQIDMEAIVALCRTALKDKHPSLCSLLSRFFHAESKLGLAAFFALVPDTPVISLTEQDLYSQEVLTAIIDFYISYRSGLVAGSLASVRYTENSITGNLRALQLPHESASVAHNTQGSSVIFGKQSSADLLSRRQGSHTASKNIDVFGAKSSSSVFLRDKGKLGPSDSVLSSSTAVGGQGTIGRLVKKSQQRTRTLTNDEFITEYVLQMNSSAGVDLSQIGNPDSIVFTELLHADLSKVSSIIDTVVARSGMHEKLSFLLQTQHLASDVTNQAENDPAIDLSYLTIPGMPSSTAEQQARDAATEDFPLPPISELVNVTATPFIRQLPTKTLKVLKDDAYLLADTTFRLNLLRIVGNEYKRRCLFEDAAYCYAQMSQLEPLAMLFIDTINVIPDGALSDTSSESDIEMYTVLLFHIIQLAFQVFQDLPNTVMSQLLVLLDEKKLKTAFGVTFLTSIKTQILSGSYSIALYKTFFKEKSSVRIDRNILHKVQQSIPRYSTEQFMIVSAYFMGSLMQAQVGHSLHLSKNTLMNLSTWDKFERVSYDGIVYRGTVLVGHVELYDKFYNAMTAGHLTQEIDGYACGGMMLGLGIIASGSPAGSGASPATILDPAKAILSNPAEYMAVFDENFNLTSRSTIKGYEAFIFGYAIGVGLMCLGTNNRQVTATLVDILISPGAFHPDSIYGVLIGIGLVHLGDSLFLKAFQFNEFYVSTFGMGMHTAKTSITIPEDPPQLYLELASKILGFLVSKHEKMRTGAALCIALCCYCTEAQANQAIEFLLDFEPRIQTSQLTSNKLCDGVQKAGPIALGLAYAHTNSLEVATQLVSIASRSTVDEVSYHGLIMIAFVLSSQRAFANELLILTAKSHRVACRQGAALALGYINAGTWDATVIEELRELMSDQVEAVRNHAIIAQAFVLQTCSAPVLPEKIKIESDPPLGDRQKDVIYAQDHNSAFIKRLKAFNKLRHVPSRIQDRAREFAGFKAAMAEKPEEVQQESKKNAEKTNKSDHQAATAAATAAAKDKDIADSTMTKVHEFAKAVQEKMEQGFTLEDYCSQFRADLLGLLTDYNLSGPISTDLNLRACMIALGILNCGGMNTSFSILTPAGLPKASATVGALLFAEAHTWHPFAPCLAMCLTPDVCVTVIPSIDATGKIGLEISEGLLLIEKAHTCPYPDLSVEKVASSWDKYIKNSKLSLGIAKKHVNANSDDADEASYSLSYVREATRMTTRRFLKEATNANLVDAVVDDSVEKKESGAPSVDDGAYSILQTPCRMLRRQLEHIIVPENSDLVPISSISQGVVVLYETVSI